MKKKREYSRIVITPSVHSLLCQKCTESRILRKAARRERSGESWNNEGIRAEMQTQRNCDATQLKRVSDAERSVHFLLSVNWKCSYLSWPFARWNGTGGPKGQSPSVAICQGKIIRTTWNARRRDKATYIYFKRKKNCIIWKFQLRKLKLFTLLFHICVKNAIFLF